MRIYDKNILLIGLTGGIASGKSEAARILKGLGAGVISGDYLGKWVMENRPEMLEWVKDTFGEEFIGGDGKLLRKKLGDFVFSHQKSKKKLDDRIFPLIYEKLKEEIEIKAVEYEALVVDAAMIFEWKIEKDFDLILTVVSPVEEVYSRLRNRNGFNMKQVENRIESQLPPELKAAGSHRVIFNDGSLKKLEAEVNRFWREQVEPRLKRS